MTVLVTDNQYNDIISSPDAWQIADDSGDADDGDSRRAVDLGTRTTTSARRFKVLVERVTGTLETHSASAYV